MKKLNILIITIILFFISCGDEVQPKYEYFTGKFAYNLVYPHDPNLNRTVTVVHERTDNTIFFINENGQFVSIIGKFTNNTLFEGYEGTAIGDRFVYAKHIDLDNLQMTYWEPNAQINDTSKIYLYAFGKRIK